MSNPRAVIAGAGLGGVTAAIGLQRIGWDVVLLERGRSLDSIQVGAGLHLWSNALRALQHLDLGDTMAAAGTRMHTQRYLTWKGKELGTCDVDKWSREVSAPTVGLSRKEAHRILAGALDGEIIRFDAEATGFEQSRKGVTVRLTNGESEQGDILIGADGINSVVRRQLHGADEPVYAGYAAWRAVCDFSHPEIPVGEMRIYWGPGARILYYNISGGRLYWLAMAKAPQGQARQDTDPKASVLRQYRGWLPHIGEMLEATPGDAILRTDITDRDPIENWGDGRVTLLGDAAHPMTPNLAQGAAQAMEDGVALANILRAGGDPVSALRDYEKLRAPRANGMLKTSRTVGRMSLQKSPVTRAVRDNVVLRTIYVLYDRSMARKDLTPVV